MPVTACARCGVAIGTRTYAGRAIALLVDGRIAYDRRLCAPCTAHVEGAVAVALQRPPARMRLL